MDQLRALRVFVCVADAGSFAQAARELDLAAAVVTRLVADLEQELGTRLIHRTTRRLSLTPLGEQYLERARQILADLDEANRLLSVSATQLRGVVRVAGLLSFLQDQLVPRLPLFRERYPGIELRLNPTAVPWTLDEKSDVTLLMQGPQALEGEFVVRPLAQTEVVLCATPDYLRRHGVPRHPADLAAHESLVPKLQGLPRQWVLRRQQGDGAEELVDTECRGAVQSSSPPLLLSAAKAGLGIAGLLTCLVADELRSGRLERVLPDWSAGHFTLYAAMPSRKFLPQRVRVFVDFLVEQFGGGGHDPWRV